MVWLLYWTTLKASCRFSHLCRSSLLSMAKFVSNRSPITCLNGCASSSQPLATMIGLDVLKKGGNAADAAVAMAAALNVTEPCSTGLGGDAFCIFYDSKTRKVKAMNASGRSPVKLTLELLQSRGFNEESGYPSKHGLAVTVPGAAAGWVECVNKFGSGRLSLKEILHPAVELARTGFPVAGPHCEYTWKISSEPLFDPRNSHGKDLLVQGNHARYQTPRMGQKFRNVKLANVIALLAEKGKRGFYEGLVSNSIVAAVKKFDGVMEKEDLMDNETTFEDPISINYRGVTLWETAPNSQGIVALIALNILKNFNLKQYKPDSKEYLHIVIEALRLAFADGTTYCADPTKSDVPVDGLLSEEYGRARAKLIQMDSTIKLPTPGEPLNYGTDTVYFTVVDKDRNACSFINSNYEGFGSGIVPEGCGFSLQNRGANFSLKPGHCNVVGPNKRPYHTIIPAMVTDSTSGELLMTYGVMGGFMQPQGHVQVLLNFVEFGMNPQEALDQPRICMSPVGKPTLIEENISESTISGLRQMGHVLEGPVKGLDRCVFGKGQAIAVKPFWKSEFNTGDESDGVLWAGCDPRCDGIAAGY